MASPQMAKPARVLALPLRGQGCPGLPLMYRANRGCILVSHRNECGETPEGRGFPHPVSSVNRRSISQSTSTLCLTPIAPPQASANMQYTRDMLPRQHPGNTSFPRFLRRCVLPMGWICLSYRGEGHSTSGGSRLEACITRKSTILCTASQPINRAIYSRSSGRTSAARRPASR
jgi:hypothetical protein